MNLLRVWLRIEQRSGLPLRLAYHLEVWILPKHHVDRVLLFILQTRKHSVDGPIHRVNVHTETTGPEAIRNSQRRSSLVFGTGCVCRSSRRSGHCALDACQAGDSTQGLDYCGE